MSPAMDVYVVGVGLVLPLYVFVQTQGVCREL
jgi:hypothetical protein